MGLMKEPNLTGTGAFLFFIYKWARHAHLSVDADLRGIA